MARPKATDHDAIERAEYPEKFGKKNDKDMSDNGNGDNGSDGGDAA